jgi:amidohydrolase
MIAGGAVDGLDYFFGGHLRPIQECRMGQATASLRHGASQMAKIMITGKTSHGARPHLGVNAINVAANMVQAINGIYIDPLIPFSIKVTQIRGGGPAINAIPAQAELAIDMRAQENDAMIRLTEKVQLLCEHIAAAAGASAQFEVSAKVPAAVVQAESNLILAEAIEKVLGPAGLVPPIVTPGGDDFHFYAIERPTLKVGFIGLGCDLTPGLHDPNMTFDHAALVDGAKIFIEAVKLVLEK